MLQAKDYLQTLFLTGPLTIYIPGSIVAILNAVTMATLYRSSAKFKSDTKDKNATKVTIMLVTLTVAFIVLTFPIWILTTLMVNNPTALTSDVHMKISNVLVVLYILNHAWNFFIYLGVNGEWRKIAIGLVTCKGATKIG